MKKLLLLSFILTFSDTPKEHRDVWQRTLLDSKTGEYRLYEFDMTMGYAVCDGHHVIIVVEEKGMGKTGIVLPIGEVWDTYNDPVIIKDLKDYRGGKIEN